MSLHVCALFNQSADFIEIAVLRRLNQCLVEFTVDVHNYFFTHVKKSTETEFFGETRFLFVLCTLFLHVSF